jgi:hypothetical protein
MAVSRGKILILATLLIWVVAAIAWLADWFVMPFPIDYAMPLRRIIMALIGAACCLPLYFLLETLKAGSWGLRAMFTLLLGTGAAIAYATAHALILPLISDASPTLTEARQIVMGVCWVFFLWIAVYYAVLSDAHNQSDRLQLSELQSALREAGAQPSDKSLWLEDSKGKHRVVIADIIWIGAERDYVRVCLKERSFLVRGRLSDYAAQLSRHGILQVHRSALVQKSDQTGQNQRLTPKRTLRDLKSRPQGAVHHQRCGQNQRQKPTQFFREG